MKILALFLLAVPCFATFQVLTAVIGPDGVSGTGTFNGTYTSGATANCLSGTGGAAPGFNAAPISVTVTGGSANFSFTMPYPGYVGDTLVIHLAPSPGCAMTGSTGSAATSSATATNNSILRGASDTFYTGNVAYQGGAQFGSDGNGYPNSAVFNSPTASLEFLASGCTSLTVWGYSTSGPSNSITLRRDGVIQSRSNLALPGALSYGTATFSVDTGSHTWMLTQSNGATAWSGAIFNALATPGCVLGTKPATRTVVAGIGSSYFATTGGGSAPQNIDAIDWGLLLDATGIIIQGPAYSGQTISGFTVGRWPCDLADYPQRAGLSRMGMI